MNKHLPKLHETSLTSSSNFPIPSPQPHTHPHSNRLALSSQEARVLGRLGWGKLSGKGYGADVLEGWGPGFHIDPTWTTYGCFRK